MPTTAFGLIILAALLGVYFLFGLVLGVLAMRKGYSFAAWVGAGGSVLLGAIALGFLPNARDASLSSSERAGLKTRGNRVGTALSLIVLMLTFLAVLTQLLSFPVSGEASRSQFFERLYFPASHLLTWVELLTLITVLCAYLARPRHSKSLLVIGSLILLILTAAYFSAVDGFQRTRLIAEAPVQLVYSCHYLARVLHYFGLAGLGIGVLASRPSSAESAA